MSAGARAGRGWGAGIPARGGGRAAGGAPERPSVQGSRSPMRGGGWDRRPGGGGGWGWLRLGGRGEEGGQGRGSGLEVRPRGREPGRGEGRGWERGSWGSEDAGCGPT